MQLYNTLTRKKEEFIPLNPPKVTFYQCGPTVYWTQHIGNMRAMTMGDIVVRTLRFFGYDVTHVRNYTDVGHLTSDADEGEDKMEKGARREGLSPDAIADKYIAQFCNDVQKINTEMPTVSARATEHIDEMVLLVKKLLANGHAYKTQKAIYFDVSTFSHYTQLSGQKLDLQKEGAGKGDVSDPEKRHSEDFALWFFRTGAHANALQHWNTELGDGFPGWHIECSAMSMKYLGETIDIHMGGVEHISVHHPNEIAQSECATGKPFVRYWLHNEHLTIDNEKMAKSAGTSWTLDDVIAKGIHPLSLRYFFLQAHYRSKQNVTLEALSASQQALGNLYQELFTLRQIATKQGTSLDSYNDQFVAALSDDFNVTKALAVVWELLRSNEAPETILATTQQWDSVLGLQIVSVLNAQIPEHIVQLAHEREAARAAKNFVESDRLRSRIEAEGFIVEDRAQNTIVKPHDPLAFFLKSK